MIAAGGDVARAKSADVKRALKKGGEELRLVCVTGTLGAGKTTLAWRAATALAANGEVVVHFCDATERGLWHNLDSFRREVRRRVYVLIDDLFLDGSAVDALQNLNSAADITVLATSRGYLYRHLPDLSSERIVLEDITPDERETVLHRLRIKEEELPWPQRQRILRAKTFFDLFDALTGDRRQEVAEMIEGLKRNANRDSSAARAFEYVCLCWQFGVALPEALLASVDSTNLHGVGERPTTNELIESKSGMLSLPEHPKIASYAADYFARFCAPQKILRDLLFAVRPREWKDMSFALGLLKSIAQSGHAQLHPWSEETRAAIERLGDEKQETFGAFTKFVAENGDRELKRMCITKSFQRAESPGAKDQDWAALLKLLRFMDVDTNELTAYRERARVGVRSRIDTGGNSELLWVAYLFFLASLWRDPEARQRMIEALEKFPRSKDVMGRAYSILKRTEDEGLIRQITTKLNAPEAKLKLAHWLWRNLKWEEARRLFAKLDQARPFNPRDRHSKHLFRQLYNGCSQALLYLDKPRDAIRPLDVVLRFYPNEPEALSNRAVCLWKLKEYGEAEGNFRQALDAAEEESAGIANPKHIARFATRFGYFLIDREKWPEARRMFIKASATDKTYAWNDLGKALCSFKLGNAANAVAQMAVAFEHRADIPEWRKPNPWRDVVVRVVKECVSDADAMRYEAACNAFQKCVDALGEGSDWAPGH